MSYEYCNDTANDILVKSEEDEVLLLVRNVSKCYFLYDRPQDRLKAHLLWRFGKSYGREFWALRDVSFDVKKGETVGIIGRNGSGKSTLLQMIAGVLKPTTGKIQINGRVAALLELGSGFNPEFTGRENVYLNAAILGIQREEMEKRFDEIASFADIGDFIDQPVKLYSSGMFVRLAFAVTTGIDVDVLLIDEALAVGDVFFRQKCYKRLEDLRQRGVAIVLVSHAMSDVEQFCQRALLLDRGNLLFEGRASESVKRYYLIQQEKLALELTNKPMLELASNINFDKQQDPSCEYFWPTPEAFFDLSEVTEVSNGWARCTGVALCNNKGEPCRVFQQGEQASFFYEFEILQDIEVPIGGLVIKNDKSIIVHGKSTLEYGSEVPDRVVRGSRLRFRQDIFLEIAVGEYTFLIGLATINKFNFKYRSSFSYSEIESKIIRICHLPTAGSFAIVFPIKRKPIQLLHHGLCNLHGNCHAFVLPPINP